MLSNGKLAKNSKRVWAERGWDFVGRSERLSASTSRLQSCLPRKEVPVHCSRTVVTRASRKIHLHLLFRIAWRVLILLFVHCSRPNPKPQTPSRPPSHPRPRCRPAAPSLRPFRILGSLLDPPARPWHRRRGTSARAGAGTTTSRSLPTGPRLIARRPPPTAPPLLLHTHARPPDATGTPRAPPRGTPALARSNLRHPPDTAQPSETCWSSLTSPRAGFQICRTKKKYSRAD